MKLIEHRNHCTDSQTISLGVLASQTHATLKGDSQLPISGIGVISQAKAGDITFLASPKYRKYLENTQASAVIVSAREAEACPVAALVCADPKLVFAQVVQLLYPHQTVPVLQHPSSVIGQDTVIHPVTHIGPHCVIGDRVKIGANVILQAGCVIGDDCEIGEGCVFYPHVTVYHGCKIGQDCTIHSGCVIGSDGFGFAKNKDRWLKVPQIGGVTIGNRVEIGANTTIDRGAIEDTVIADDVILDNLIQIGHNVKIGSGTAVAACVGIAGSTEIGKHCLIGGASRINGHIQLADYVNIVGCSNVGQSIDTPGAYASALTVTDIKAWKKNIVRFRQLDNLATRLFELEKKLKAQEA